MSSAKARRETPRSSGVSSADHNDYSGNAARGVASSHPLSHYPSYSAGTTSTCPPAVSLPSPTLMQENQHASVKHS